MAKRFLLIYFPIDGQHLVQILATAMVVWPDAWVGAVPEGMVVADQYDNAGTGPKKIAVAVETVLESIGAGGRLREMLDL